MARKSSLKSIEAKIRELQAKAKALKVVEKPGIKELRSVVAKFKLKPSDIKLALNGSAAKGKAPRKSGGKKLKPKYQNPANRIETWAGRGLKPKWIVAALKGGKKLEDFAI
ncbi:H-NS family nucleoid-associated regulatory protein [Rhodoferax sp.]|uniref:H-NS histone family protein n=1 Tax=Rhodoferax sp. TaxID=50421 RepID=UPI00277AB60C|nr:H-NS histone family protein [Rhodoferax sp.]